MKFICLYDNYEVSSPKYNEICTTINELTSNNAAGADNVPPELTKNGGRTLKQKLCKLILKICDKNNFHYKEIKELYIQCTKRETHQNVTTVNQSRYLILHLQYLLCY